MFEIKRWQFKINKIVNKRAIIKWKVEVISRWCCKEKPRILIIKFKVLNLIIRVLEFEIAMVKCNEVILIKLISSY